MMGILRFIKRKELKEIKLLQAQLITAEEKEVSLTTHVQELENHCEEILACNRALKMKKSNVNKKSKAT